MTTLDGKTFEIYAADDQLAIHQLIWQAHLDSVALQKQRSQGFNADMALLCLFLMDGMLVVVGWLA